MRTAKFEIFRSEKNGEYYFHLKASGNSEIILDSEGYKAKSSCEKGIASVIKNAADESNFKKLESRNGQFYFNLIAQNGEIIGTSEMYKSKQGRDNGIRSVMENAPNAITIDLTVDDDVVGDRSYEIIVNGRLKTVISKTLTFIEIVKLAFGEVISDGNRIYTMTFKKGVAHHPEGILVEGDTIKIKKGVIFNVTATDKS